MKKIEVRAGTQTVFALVDDADYGLLSQLNWALDKDGYPTLGGGRVMHNFVTDYLLTDHKNLNKLDNRRKNLRPATPSQNSANRGPLPNNTSGVPNVWYCKRSNMWRIRIECNARIHTRGGFTDFNEAVRVRNELAVELFGEYARIY